MTPTDVATTSRVKKLKMLGSFYHLMNPSMNINVISKPCHLVSLLDTDRVTNIFIFWFQPGLDAAMNGASVFSPLASTMNVEDLKSSIYKRRAVLKPGWWRNVK